MSDDNAVFTHLSKQVRRDLGLLLQGDESISSEDLLEAIKQNLDGQELVALETTLDDLRDHGAYQLSVPLLEEAWNAELPLDFLGRVVQDWVGTVLFGLGDRKGAHQVAKHLMTRVQSLGATFASDFCDLLLEWEFFDLGEKIATWVAQKQPGDLSAQFHLGICAKMKCEWEKAALHFEKVAQSQEDPSTQWNLALMAVAQKQWTQARSLWQKVGFQIPDGEGDYAMAGELSPIRLSLPSGFPARSEVIWGTRIGPARVQLTNLPYYHPHFKCGDILLIDGVKSGEVDYQEQKYPITPALAVWQKDRGESYRLFALYQGPQEHQKLTQAIHTLAQDAWVLTDWTERLPVYDPQGNLLVQLGIYIPVQRQAIELLKPLHELTDQLDLFHPQWAEVTGQNPEIHLKKLMEWGLMQWMKYH
jgi:hypothetical protein